MRSWRCRNKKLKVEFMHFNILCWSKQGREPKISLSILFLPFALANLFLNPHFCLSLFNNSHNLSYIIKFSIFFMTVKKKKKKSKTMRHCYLPVRCSYACLCQICISHVIAGHVKKSWLGRWIVLHHINLCVCCMSSQIILYTLKISIMLISLYYFIYIHIYIFSVYILNKIFKWVDPDNLFLMIRYHSFWVNLYGFVFGTFQKASYR